MNAKFLVAAMCVTALASSAQAAGGPPMIQIDDVGESLVLYLNGSAHNFDGEGITDFHWGFLPGGGTDPGEFMHFTWTGPLPFVGPPIYTQLLEPGSQVISDHFLLHTYNAVPGSVRVLFVSNDGQFQPPPGYVYPGPLPPLSSWSGLEVPVWQTVGQVYDGLGGVVVTFQVMSVPEPESFAMMLAGLGLLGFMARRKSKTPA